MGRAGWPRHVFVADWPSIDTNFVLGEGDGLAWFGLAEALARPDLTERTRRDLERLASECDGVPRPASPTDP